MVAIAKQWEFTVGDRRVSIAATLLNSKGKPIDLTGMTFKFRMTPEDTDTPKINDQAATVDDALKAEVSYSWAAADVDTPGTFDYQWIIVDGSGKTEHFPAGEQAKLGFIDPV